MATYNVIGEQSRRWGADARLDLYDEDGGKWSFVTSADGGTLTLQKEGTTLWSMSTAGANPYLRLGSPEACTIVSGALTVTKSFVEVTSESSTSDQVDTITKADVQEGDILIICGASGHTITVDDANIDLGAGTRAVAGQNQFLTLIYNGSSWSELAFTAGDNA